MSPLTQTLLARMNVTIRYFSVEDSGYASPYPHGNKILASSLPRNTKSAIFFDTDTVVTGSFDISGLDKPHSLFVAPECTATWGRNEQDWIPIYSMFGLPMPTERVRLFRGRRLSMLPYFNAGLVGYSTAPNADGMTFPDLWLDTAARIDHVDTIRNKRPWLDQIALPIAAARLGAQFDVRGEDYNFNLYKREPSDEVPIRLMHYHQACVYRGWPKCVAIAEDLLYRCEDGPEADALDLIIRPFLRERPRRQKAAIA